MLPRTAAQRAHEVNDQASRASRMSYPYHSRRLISLCSEHVRRSRGGCSYKLWLCPIISPGSSFCRMVTSWENYLPSYSVVVGEPDSVSSTCLIEQSTHGERGTGSAALRPCSPSAGLGALEEDADWRCLLLSGWDKDIQRLLAPFYCSSLHVLTHIFGVPGHCISPPNGVTMQ